MQAYGLTQSRLSDYPIRVLVQLFIDSSFFFFLLQITAGDRGLIRICFPFLFPAHEHILEIVLNKITFFFELGCPGNACLGNRNIT